MSLIENFERVAFWSMVVSFNEAELAAARMHSRRVPIRNLSMVSDSMNDTRLSENIGQFRNGIP